MVRRGEGRDVDTMRCEMWAREVRDREIGGEEERGGGRVGEVWNSLLSDVI